jgi:hypothetical protein
MLVPAVALPVAFSSIFLSSSTAPAHVQHNCVLPIQSNVHAGIVDAGKPGFELSAVIGSHDIALEGFENLIAA